MDREGLPTALREWCAFSVSGLTRPSSLIDKAVHGPPSTRSFLGSGHPYATDYAARHTALYLYEFSAIRPRLMQLLGRLYVPLRKLPSTQVPIRPLIRQYLSRPSTTMDLSTDATERVRMSFLQLERVWLTIMADGLSAP
jgi:hypothetical protein